MCHSPLGHVCLGEKTHCVNSIVAEDSMEKFLHILRHQLLCLSFIAISAVPHVIVIVNSRFLENFCLSFIAISAVPHVHFIDQSLHESVHKSVTLETTHFTNQFLYKPFTS